MKALKIIGGIIVMLIIAVAIIVAVAFSQLNRIVEEVIESTGSELTQTAVDVSGVDISLRDGKGQLGGLSIANPAGFTDNSLLSVGDVALQIDVQSVLEPVKVIKLVQVDGISLRAEQKELIKTNIQALLDTIKQRSASSSSSSTGGGDSASSKAEEDVRLFIEKLAIGESQLTLEAEKWGARTVTIPAYQQSNIGNRASGSSPEAIAKEIISTILATAKKTVETELKAAAKAELDKRFAEEKAKLKKQVDEKLAAEKAKLNERLSREEDKLKQKLSEEGVDLNKIKSLLQ